MRLQVRIIILNYNGAELLPLCLPSIAAAAQNSSHDISITILDNQSTDNGLDYVRKNFPLITIENSPENLFLCSYNDYLKKISEPYVILLNNDIKVDIFFIDPLIDKLNKNSNNFLVAPRVLEFTGNILSVGRSRADVRWGLFWCSGKYPGCKTDAEIPSKTYSSGFGAFNRILFCQLGGYDLRYLPGIMEDVDLCHRAQQRGYDLYYEPHSVVYHIGQASFKKKFGNSKMERLAHRNNFLFMWKNFRTFSFWASHIFWLPFRLLGALVRGKGTFVQGFWEALCWTWGNRK